MVSLLLNSFLGFVLGVGHVNLACRTNGDGKDGPEMDDLYRRVQFGTVDNRALRIMPGGRGPEVPPTLGNSRIVEPGTWNVERHERERVQR